MIMTLVIRSYSADLTLPLPFIIWAGCEGKRELALENIFNIPLHLCIFIPYRSSFTLQKSQAQILEWDSVLQQFVPSRTYTKHKHRPKKGRIADSDQQGEPQLDLQPIDAVLDFLLIVWPSLTNVLLLLDDLLVCVSL